MRRFLLRVSHFKFITPTAAGLLALICAASLARGEDWPCWRGPRGDGSSHEAGIPTRWSGSENIAWKTAIPGLGHASPIVWHDRVFLISCIGDTTERVLVCLDRNTGRTLWQRTVFKAPLEKKHSLNSFASSTPATDGQRVYVSFLDVNKMMIAAYDFAGRQLWLEHPGVFSSVHGYCSSPIVYEDTLIINGDHDGDAYLVALDRATGKEIWKTPRENKTRSYCTPIIRTIDGQPQMILSGSKSVGAYDPRTGAPIWTMDGPTEQFVASMVDNGKLVFLTAGFPEHHILALRPNGRGNVTDSAVVWRTTENTSYVPSPVVIGDYFLVVADNGIASCYAAADGQRQWKQRIGRHYSASLISAGGLAYFLSDDGVTKIIKPGPHFDLVAENELGESCYASPAASDGHLFIRADHHLYCIGPATEGQAAR
jgi:hypothetical protein